MSGEHDLGAAYMAIANLIGTYAQRLDRGDFEGMTALFGDAVITTGTSEDRLEGSEAILAAYSKRSRRYDDDGTPHTQHVTTNLIIDIDLETGTANASSYWTVFQQTDALPLQPILSGEYRDEFRLRGGVWSFSRRHIQRRLVGNTDHHVRT